MQFNKCISPCCQHPDQDLEYYITPKSSSCSSVKATSKSQFILPMTSHKWDHRACIPLCLALPFNMFLRSIHVVICISSSSLFNVEFNSIVKIYQNLSIHSPADGYLSCFQSCVIARLLWTFLYKCFMCVIYFHDFGIKHLRME